MTSPQGRFAQGAALLDGELLRSADAHGKHLFLGFAGDGRRRPAHWLHVHLGLYGRWELSHHGEHAAPADPRGAVRVRLLGDTVTADLRGPTVCEVLDPQAVESVHARLGADPLRPSDTAEDAWARIHASRTPIGALLMQQDVVAGVGNVYRAEALFRARLDPHRPGREVDHETWAAVFEDLRVLMRAGVRSGTIVTTVREHRGRRTGTPRAEDRVYVYKRTGLPCRICGTPVVAEAMAARTLYRCPTCQAP